MIRELGVWVLMTAVLVVACASDPRKPQAATHDAQMQMVSPTARGAMLYENHCTICHTSVVHVRENHRATSDVEVENWVRRWSADQKLGWSDEDVDDVTRYLLATFYKL